jgi:hypothetical protein
MRLLLIRRPVAPGGAVIRFGLLWCPPPPPDPSDPARLTGPPPGHPERLSDEALPPELERLLQDCLGAS